MTVQVSSGKQMDDNSIYVGETYRRGLHESLRGTLDAYCLERDDYFHDKFCGHPEEGEIAKAIGWMRGIAHLFIGGVEDLASAKGVPDARAAFDDLIKACGDRSTLSAAIYVQNEEIEVQIVRVALAMAREAQNRFWSLFAVMENAAPGKKTAHFLRRISRSYLFGFDAECTTICRGALDAEFESRVSRDDCRGAQRTNSVFYSLEDRILTAHRLGLISSNAMEAAHRVRRAGNSAVHSKPPSGDALPLIKDVVLVLSELTS